MAFMLPSIKKYFYYFDKTTKATVKSSFADLVHCAVHVLSSSKFALLQLRSFGMNLAKSLPSFSGMENVIGAVERPNCANGQSVNVGKHWHKIKVNAKHFIKRFRSNETTVFGIMLQHFISPYYLNLQQFHEKTTILELTHNRLMNEMAISEDL